MNKIGFFFPVIFLILSLLNYLLFWDPYVMNFESILMGPNLIGIMGYDDFGRNIFFRLINGFLVSFKIVFFATLISFTLGICIGIFSGFVGGWLDRIINSLMTFIQAFPGILLIIAIAAFLETNFWNILFALTISTWISFARIARSQTLAVKKSEYVQAAVSIGSNRFRVLHKHILPNVMTPILVELNFTIANLIVAEAGLAFLGLGISSPFPSWGGMLRDSVDYLLVAPHYLISVASCMVLMILSFNLIGKGLNKFD